MWTYCYYFSKDRATFKISITYRCILFNLTIDNIFNNEVAVAVMRNIIELSVNELGGSTGTVPLKNINLTKTHN